MGNSELRQALEAILAPMVESDHGELFLVAQSERHIHLHLRGRFAGCPGNGLVTHQVIVPLIRALDCAARVEVTSGPIVPDGATRLEAHYGATSSAS